MKVHLLEYGIHTIGLHFFTRLGLHGIEKSCIIYDRHH